MEAAVSVEQRRPDEPGAGRELGDGLVGGGGFERAGAAAVDDRQLGELADRGDDRRPPLGELGGGAALHRADQGTAHAAARRFVADAGDLALV